MLYAVVRISLETALRWIPQDLDDDGGGCGCGGRGKGEDVGVGEKGEDGEDNVKSTLALHCQATRYLTLCMLNFLAET